MNEGSERELIEAGFRREDADFYCLHCAYPLRGLPGDPIRCPECFCSNPRSKLLVVRIRRFEKVLHKLDQTAYRSAILYFAVELTTAIVFLWRRLAAPVWLVVFASSSVLFWWLASAWFTRMCRRIPGGMAGFVRYELLMVPSIATGLLVVLAFSVVGYFFDIVFVVCGFLVGVLAAWALNPTRRLQQRATALLAPLAREMTRQPPKAGR